MPNEQNAKSENVGEMHRRRETMSDNRRYLIYYTFGPNVVAVFEDAAAQPSESEVNSETV